jgi:epoxyqueuosine reductase
MLADEVKAAARALGFSHVGIAPARPLPEHQRAFQRYLTEGRHGGMAYLAREPERRADPTRLVPGAKTVIALGVPYYQGDHGSPTDGRPAGKIARYAWGLDYHALIEARLTSLTAFIQERAPGATIRCAVDHAPVLERAYAQEAGLGFIGKHTLLITPEHGSWVVLAEMITDLDLPCDEPGANACGSCTRCLEACPTGALVGPFQLDAARCVSYLTIEHKGETPDELLPGVGEWLFGCDACQDACPYNQRVTTGPLLPGLEREAGSGPWVPLDEASAPRSRSAFARRFAGSALPRAGVKGLRRNAAAVRQNLATKTVSAPARADGLPLHAAARSTPVPAARLAETLGNVPPRDRPVPVDHTAERG